MKNHVDVVHISHVKEERGQSGTMISFCFSSCSFSHLVLSVIAICMREANKCIDRQKTRLPRTRRHRAASSTRRACLPWVVANKKVASDLRKAVGAEEYNKCVAQGFRG